MHKLFISITLIVHASIAFAQASFTAMGSPYSQNFNSLPNVTDGADLATWVNDGTLAGWYIDEGNGPPAPSCNTTSCNDRPTIEASYTSPNNGGNAYIFASGSDRSIGSRAAGSTGIIHYGVRIKNNTGATISSIYVDYYGEQWSIAENGTNINTIAFSYQTGASMTSLTAGTWTAVSSLDFTQIYTSSQSAGMGGTACTGTSSQCLALDGNATANRVHIQGCITVNIPAGEEIMLRWTDIDNGSNDHHMQIDDVNVYPYDVSCAIVLPVEMVFFNAQRDGNVAQLDWQTSSETNNDYFEVERAGADGLYHPIGRISGHGTTSQTNSYTLTDEMPLPGINYYRLKQVDYNGQFEYEPVRIVEFPDDGTFKVNIWYSDGFHFLQSGNIGATEVTVFSEDGAIIYSTQTEDQNGILEINCANGVYYVRFENATESRTVKVAVLQH